MIGQAYSIIVDNIIFLSGIYSPCQFSDCHYNRGCKYMLYISSLIISILYLDLGATGSLSVANQEYIYALCVLPAPANLCESVLAANSSDINVIIFINRHAVLFLNVIDNNILLSVILIVNILWYVYTRFS